MNASIAKIACATLLAGVASTVGSCDSAESPTGGPPTGNGVGAVASVTVTPASLKLFIGGTTQLTVTAHDAAGNVVSQVSVAWTSNDGTVASVSQTGLVTALKAGNANVTATVSGISAGSAIEVEAPPAGTGDVIVNAGITYQTMTGWEAHPQSGEQNADFPFFKDELFDRAVNELGINRVRIVLFSGSEQDADYLTLFRNGQIDHATWVCKRTATTNDNGDPFNLNLNGFHFSTVDPYITDVVQPLRQRLQARGEDLHISVSYHAANKTKDCGNYPYHHDDDPEEFAEFVLAYFLHLQDEFGIVPKTFELMNEPNNTLWWQRGKELGAALVATMNRLNANGFNPRVVAPSLAFAHLTPGYLDEMDQTPGALALFDELSYHRYDGPGNALLESLQARAASIGATTSMLEKIGADHNDLYNDLVHAQVSAWQQFALAFPIADNGAQYYVINTSSPGNPKVVLSSRARYLSQYFKYVREGAQRVHATSSISGVKPVAFVGPNGKMVVVANLTRARNFTVGGLAAGTYDITYTTGQVLQADGGSSTIQSGGEVSVSVPAAGVVTIFAR